MKEITLLNKYNYPYLIVNNPYAKRNQPRIKKTPPIGVNGPKKETSNVKSSLIDNKYKDPEKKSIPKIKNMNTHFLVLTGTAVANPINNMAST